MKEQSGWAWNAITLLPNVSVDLMNDYVRVSDNYFLIDSDISFCCRYIRN
jgi:hypothetical protein